MGELVCVSASVCDRQKEREREKGEETKKKKSLQPRANDTRAHNETNKDTTKQNYSFTL